MKNVYIKQFNIYRYKYYNINKKENNNNNNNNNELI